MQVVSSQYMFWITVISSQLHQGSQTVQTDSNSKSVRETLNVICFKYLVKEQNETENININTPVLVTEFTKCRSCSRRKWESAEEYL